MITNAITYSLIVGIAKERYKLQHFTCTLDIFCFQISQMKAKHLVNLEHNYVNIRIGLHWYAKRCCSPLHQLPETNYYSA